MLKIDKQYIKTIAYLRWIVIPKPHSGLHRRRNGMIYNNKLDSLAVAEPRACKKVYKEKKC